MGDTDYLAPQKCDVKQFKVFGSASAAEGIGIKHQEFLFQRMYCTIHILLLAEKDPG